MNFLFKGMNLSSSIRLLRGRREFSSPCHFSVRRMAFVLAAALAIPSSLLATPHPGPDTFGYSSEADLTGDSFYKWDEISDTGTLAETVSNGNERNQTVPIPFPFTFYGNQFNSCVISDNGLIGFMPEFTGEDDISSTTIPSLAGQGNIIAGWWGNLNPGQGGSVYYHTLGSAPNRRFVVQYEAVRENGSSRTYTFQIKLFERTHVIETHYKSIAGGSNIRWTAGIENSTEDRGLQTQRNIVPTSFTEQAFRYKLADPFPVTIKYEYDGHTTRELPLKELHVRGESVRSDGTARIRFESPRVIYLDRDLNLTGGITGSTLYIGRHTGISYSFTGPTPYSLPLFTSTSPNINLNGIPVGVNGGTFTWKWTLEELPPPAITVESEFGAEKVTPRRGRFRVADNSQQTFKAPEFIYLNRDFEELDSIGSLNGDESKIAYYRARNVGYSIDGEPVQGAKLAFTQTITRDIKIDWQWELEYAVFIESATSVPPPGEPEPGDATGNPTPRIGREWARKDTELTAAIDRVAENDLGGFRFQSAGYELSNVRGPDRAVSGDQYYWKLKESAEGFFHRPSGTYTESDGATVAWWGKIDRKLDSKRDEVFMTLYEDTSFSDDLAELDNEERWLNSMTFGVRADGQFFVAEVTPSSEKPTGTYRELVSLPADLVGLDWHHWAVVFDFADGKRNIRVYRDTVLVFNRTLPVPADSDGNEVSSSDPSYLPGILEGVYRESGFGSAAAYRTAEGVFGREQFEGGINNVAIVASALSQSSVISHATGSGSGFGHITRSMENEPIFTSGNAIDGVTRELFPKEARQVLRVHEIEEDLDEEAGERVVTKSITVDDWLRIKWRWDGQVRYRFSAKGVAKGESATAFDGQAFVRFNGRSHFVSDGESDVWIDTGTKVTIGAFYRTFDRCFTLLDFGVSPGGDMGRQEDDISELRDATLITDSQGRTGRVARTFVVDQAEKPTVVRWLYEDTVFRAEIPLGSSLEASNPNPVLVPNLCEGAVLSESGPVIGLEEPLDPEPDGIAGEGGAIRWDRVAKKLFPVRPGNNRIRWKDASNGRTYRIEVVSGYPGDTVELSSEKEDDDGKRPLSLTESSLPVRDSNGDQVLNLYYVLQTELPDVGNEFPAKPGAHYHHLHAPEERQPPTKLDLDSTDQWAFRELTYSDRTTKAEVDDGNGKAFTTKSTGRSVLLYSYRTDPNEAADGNEDEERLAVRVVRSSAITPLQPTDPKLVLGRRGLALGTGPGEDGAYAIVQRDSKTTSSLNLIDRFAISYWLNAKGLRPDDKPVTILSTGGGNLKITLDPATSTLTANYRGLEVTHPFSTAGPTWRHHLLHVFQDKFFGIETTIINFYVDGERREQGAVSALLAAPHANSQVSEGVDASSFRFGAGANPRSGLQLDEFALVNTPFLQDFWIEPGHLHNFYRSGEFATASQVFFRFEEDPEGGSFSNDAADFFFPIPDLGLGPISADSLEESWAHVALQEVATRLDSTLDQANFDGTGYILNRVSNYNAQLYDREAEVGSWGPIYPVNDSRKYAIYTDATAGQKLEVAYYENPFLRDEEIHPNVAWPYEVAAYDNVVYPTEGPHKDKRIYIASRVGSEGVDVNGRPQHIFGLDRYANLEIYHEPSRSVAGFNPNDEHALVAPSNRAALKIRNEGEELSNNPPLAAFALQRDLNEAIHSYTSDPWVLVQVDNLVTGEQEMAAYRVEKQRGTNASEEERGTLHFPRPSDDDVNQIDGLRYESAPNPEDRFLIMDPEGTYDFSYDFHYPVSAGDLLIPPYPLNLVVGNVAMQKDRGTNGSGQRTFWRDVNGAGWVVSGGGGQFLHQFHYPFRPDFYFPGFVAPGTEVAWVPSLNETTQRRSFIPGIRPTGAGRVKYTSQWRSDYPKLKRGETLTYQGGEYFNETPGSNGLPAVVAMKAAEVVYDDATPTMLLDDNNVGNYSARIIRPLDRHEAPFKVSEMKDAGFSPASTKIFIVAERWYFKELPGSLQRRFYFDSLAEKLVFRGFLNDKDGGDPDLTQGPDPINILEPNIITADDLLLLVGLSQNAKWGEKVALIRQKSKNPTRARAESPSVSEITGRYLAGVKEPPTVTERLKLNGDLFPPDGDLTEENAKLKLLADDYREARERIKISTPSGIVSLNGQSARHPGAPLPNAVSLEKLKADVANFGSKLEELADQAESKYAPLDSLGVGAALIPNENILTRGVAGSTYVTIVENNRRELDGAPVSLHIIEIVPDRFRGAIKVIEGADAFSEKITLQHNGDFGAKTGNLYYEWWIRDAAPLDVVAEEIRADGTLKEVDERGQSLWQQYIPKNRASLASDLDKHLGLHTIVFEGRPDVTLADKLVLVRYRHRSESRWNLVPFEITNPAREWRSGSPAPFQWAGAANSPQLQADGSKRYVPQLVMGWVKRILDRINPYEARYTDFFSNETPATYSSQIQIAGPPFAGKVALNPDKNVIENTGLIELYETVLARARELSIDNSSNAVSTDGINQALLLAATRLSVLYELLAREAYSDAQDSTISVTDESGLERVASFTHAFQNFEASLQHEELALLRGTDFRKSFPVYNRLFWNYAKGLGEAAYNVNYRIYDENTDGFINEDDARALYPQGHGDAWGHFVSALGMHYTLLQHPVFSWKTRSELYSLMQNVLEVDFLDEKTFAKLAAGRARTGRDIVRGTYRLHYTQDPDGQWQGYTDSANPARAWGVGEWATRSGQAAYFDWAVANSLLPDEAEAASPVSDPENLDRLERLGALDEIGEIAGGLYEIQLAMDEANGGVNPLGFDSDTLTFDLDPILIDGVDNPRSTHFEQVYERAVAACNNALHTLNFASKSGNKLMRLADNSEAMIVEAFRQDLDYRNRLIEIFGRPYDGTIGFGKVYPEGYEGPDTQLFAYLDHTTIDEIIPQTDSNRTEVVRFDVLKTEAGNFAENDTVEGLYADVYGNFFQNIGVTFSSLGGAFLGVGTAELQNAFHTLRAGSNLYEDFSTTKSELALPVRRNSPYAFQSQSNWGQRTSYGRLQQILEEELRERIALESAIAEYIAFLQDFEATIHQLDGLLHLSNARDDINLQIVLLKRQLEIAQKVLRAALFVASKIDRLADRAAKAAKEFLPTSVGFSVDVGAPGRGGLLTGTLAVRTASDVASKTATGLFKTAEFLAALLVGELELDLKKTEELSEIEGILVKLVGISGKEVPLRNAIGTRLQNLEMKKQEYLSAQAEGFRLLREREGFNKILAAKAQKNRYQDMIFRISRNEAMTKYQSAFQNAARYTWLAARAYDYETSLAPGDPAAPGPLLDQIVKERQLGLWAEGDPQSGQGGLAEILHQLNANFQVLKGQLGINNPQSESEKISLRSELFRIGPGEAAGGLEASDNRWVDALKARKVADLNSLPEFVRHCRPIAGDGPQPGIVLRFGTSIESGRNVFGLPLMAGDHNYSTANFATKVRGFGVWLENYNAAGLATTPRAYLVPVGNDYLRQSSSREAFTRMWSVQEQRIPTPFVINDSNLIDPGFIPSLNGVDGGFSELRRHGDFRVYHDAGGSVDEGELILNSRLIGRSVWNSDWLLIIPGAGLHGDPDTGLDQLAETISDIKLHFSTYSHQGQ